MFVKHYREEVMKGFIIFILKYDINEYNLILCK